MGWREGGIEGEKKDGRGGGERRDVENGEVGRERGKGRVYIKKICFYK